LGPIFTCKSTEKATGTPGSILSYLDNTKFIHGTFELSFSNEEEKLSSWKDNEFIKRSFNEITNTQRKTYPLSKFISELELLTDPSAITGFIFDLNLNPEFLSFTEEKCYLCLQTGEKVLFNSEGLSIFLQVLGNVYFRRFHDIYSERESLNNNLVKILQNRDYNAISLIEEFLKDILDQEFVFKLGNPIKSKKDKQEVEVTIERAFSSPLWRISSSTARIIALAHLFTSSRVNQIIILDDPGLHLHPRGERALARKLEELSKDHQLLLSTHSSRFLVGHAYLVELRKGWTKISPIRGRRSMKRVVKLLGIRPSDSFGSDVVVFVEGRTDARVYRVFEDKIKSNWPTRVTYIGVGGWTNIKFALSVELLRSKFVRSKAIAITDGDIVESENYPKIKANWGMVFPKETFLSLKEECIESLFLNNPIVFIRLANNLDSDTFPNIERLKSIIVEKRNQGISDKTITVMIIEKY
jgi:energy-coupling factor transporter ATP-binding protein EcfA2